MEATRSTRILAIVRQVIARRAEEAEDGAESGFTLIELMVVLLIMAILLAIAIPTFLGVKGGAQDRSAQSDLTNGLTAAKAYYTNVGSYGTAGAVVASMTTSEPELSWQTGSVTSGTAHGISVAVYDTGQVLVLATQSASGTCWYAADVEASGGDTTDLTGAGHAGVWYGSYTPNPASTGCDAGTLTNVTNWGSTYPA
jgi:type IV pilus assembly protein PilA